MTTRSLVVLLVAAAGFCLASPALRAQQPSPAEIIEKRVPSPPAVGARKLAVGFEVPAPLEFPSVMKIRDGRLMMIGSGKIAYSSDGGKTWSKPQVLPVPVSYAIRLNSGKIGGPVPVMPKSPEAEKKDLDFYVSANEGKTWQRQGRITVSDVPADPYPKTMIQTKSGRLILPVRFTYGAGHMGLYNATGSFGTLNGKFVKLEGHAHWPEPDNTFVYYSDDEGQTWHRSEGGIMIWLKHGYGGMWPCDEPSAIEAKDGDIFVYCRNTLGRIYTAHSGSSESVTGRGKVHRYTPGERFDFPQPTALAASYSPCAITRIPSTGDLLIVWNEVTGDEIRASYRRGRLESAISKDDGKTWEYFRTIDSVVLPPVGRLRPDPVLQMARGLDYVGVVPEDYGSVDYPTINIVGNKVFLFWYRDVVVRRPGDVTGRRMRVLPLSWFYQDGPPAPPSPKLIIRVPTDGGHNYRSHVIPARYWEGRFYCNLSDLARYLKSPVGRLGKNMYAPVNQVITCLGWSPKYDRSHLSEHQNPRLIVTVEPPGQTP